MMGSMNKETSFKLLDAYYAAGGRSIDTANIYQVRCDVPSIASVNQTHSAML